jgi:hypothetical protein
VRRGKTPIYAYNWKGEPPGARKPRTDGARSGEDDSGSVAPHPATGVLQVHPAVRSALAAPAPAERSERWSQACDAYIAHAASPACGLIGSEGRSVADDAYTQAINKALSSAKSMLGKNEVPDREEIQSYLHDGGQDLDPHKLAWCAAFVSASLQKAGLPVPTHVIKDSAVGPGAYAGNYLTYGSAVDQKNVQAGDILVANNGSHVGFAERACAARAKRSRSAVACRQ